MKAGHIIALAAISAVAGAQFTQFQSQLATPYQAIRYQLVAQGNNSHITQPDLRAVKTANEWAELYRAMAGDPKAQVPNVCDFKSYDLLVLHAGQRMTGGYSIYVSMIRQEKAGEVMVDFVLMQPTVNSIVSQGITSPYAVVVVEKQSAPYKFRGSVSYVTTKLGGPTNGCCSCGCPHCGGGTKLSPGGTTTGGEIIPKPTRTGNGRGGGQ